MRTANLYGLKSIHRASSFSSRDSAVFSSRMHLQISFTTNGLLPTYRTHSVVTITLHAIAWRQCARPSTKAQTSTERSCLLSSQQQFVARCAADPTNACNDAEFPLARRLLDVSLKNFLETASWLFGID